MKIKTYKKFLGIILAAIMLNSCTTTASNTEETDDISTGITDTDETTASSDSIESEDGEYYPKAEYSEFDLKTAISSDAVYISFNGNDVQTTDDIEIGDGYIKISDGGDYVLSGEFNGQIIVESDDNVHLILSGVTLCADMSPVYVASAKNVCITLAADTVNTVSDSTSYTYEGDENEPAAAVYSKADLTINGEGELTVNGNYDKGIHSKDDLKIVSGTITVNSQGDAIKGKDCLLIKSGVINVTSGEDGLKSNNDTDEEKGYVIIDGGSINISAGDDAVHAESWLIVNDGEINVPQCYEGLEGMKVEIYGGDINIVSSDDTINAASGSSSGFGNFDKNDGTFDFDGTNEDGSQTPPEKQAFDGTFDFGGTNGDGSQTPPEKQAFDGTFDFGGTNEDGSQTPPEKQAFDGTFDFDGTNGDGSQTPPEKPNNERPDDTTEKYDEDSTDSDNFANRGKGFGGFGNFGGGGTFNEEAEEGVYIKIYGGNITVSGGNDVFDSNGTLEIFGGNITVKNKNMVVYGDPDCIIDTNGTVSISGGTFIAFSRGESSASQVVSIPSITLSVEEDGTAVSVVNENGEIVLEIQNTEKCSALYIASDKLISGNKYTVTCGEDSREVTAK